jgi:hypothetical protein
MFWTWKRWLIVAGTGPSLETLGFSLVEGIRKNMEHLILRNVRITQHPKRIEDTIRLDLLRRAYENFNASLIRPLEDGEIREVERTEVTMEDLVPGSLVYDVKTTFTASGLSGEGLLRCDLSFITTEDLRGTYQDKLEVIVRSARIRLGMASRTGGKMAKKEEKIDLILGELRNGYHHLINKDLTGALLSSSDLRRLSQREDIAVHVLEVFGPVSYNVGTEPLRRIEAKIWTKFHQMASDLTSGCSRKQKPSTLTSYISCDRMFKAKHMLIGNIPY